MKLLGTIKEHNIIQEDEERIYINTPIVTDELLFF